MSSFNKCRVKKPLERLDEWYPQIYVVLQSSLPQRLSVVMLGGNGVYYPRDEQ
ncbi:hypothetical protein BGZ49_004981, partial [Haplosporangium sp. Z 27]